MTAIEMKEILSKISNETFQTKVLNVLLSQYSQIKQLEKIVVELQQKVNEIIEFINKKDAAPVNEEEDLIINDIAAASQE